MLLFFYILVSPTSALRDEAQRKNKFICDLVRIPKPESNASLYKRRFTISRPTPYSHMSGIIEALCKSSYQIELRIHHTKRIRSAPTNPQFKRNG
jgi:hypothetical protein